jgi:dolichyl-phosphate-mannose-protein mannosyltransferase
MADVSLATAIDSVPDTAVESDQRALRDRLVPRMPVGGLRGWVGPLVVTALAAILRLVDLARPNAVVFDETYYIKDALSLLLFGYERQTVEEPDAIILDTGGDPAGLASVFIDGPSFVVHPPLGKWIIASGEQIFGVTPFGWRIAVAVLGILSVLLAARIVRRLTRSNLLGTLAGLFLALDGLAIVMSRTALLDNSLMFFILVAFGCLLIDRDRTRARFAEFGETTSAIGAQFLWRPWRLAAGVSLGLACGVKWSGLYFIVAFGLLTVLWDLGTRRAVGVRMPWRASLAQDAVPAFFMIVGAAALAYLATWTGWFLSNDAWSRNWAAENPSSFSWIPDSLRSLWHYHVEAWNFHTNLDSDHSYEANAWGWPLQARPTSFLYESPADVCGDARCSQEVLALGNPLIWWAGAVALIHQLWRWVGRRDWRSGAVLCGFAAGWVPWLFFENRTIFSFYSIVMLPFVIMALVLSLGVVLGPADAPSSRRTRGAILVGVFVVLVVIASWYFYPIWVGDAIPYSDWNLRMWFPSWV